MAKRILKYKLKMEDVVHVNMPADAQLLTVQTQMGEPMIWALSKVPEENSEEEGPEMRYRTFMIVGTGHEREDIGGQFSRYIGTFQLSGGALVFHVFEKIE